MGEEAKRTASAGTRRETPSARAPERRVARAAPAQSPATRTERAGSAPVRDAAHQNPLEVPARARVEGRGRAGYRVRRAGKAGRLTQRLECLPYTEEVGGSNPSSPTRRSRHGAAADADRATADDARTGGRRVRRSTTRAPAVSRHARHFRSRNCFPRPSTPCAAGVAELGARRDTRRAPLRSA